LKNTKLITLATTFPRWKGDITPAFVFDLAKRLAKKSINVTVLAPHDNNAKMKENLDGLMIYRFPYFFPKRYQRLAYHGGILPRSQTDILSKIQIPFLFFSELLYSLVLIKKKKYDIVHSHWIVPSGLIGALSHKLLGIKHVTTVHAAGILGLKKIPFNHSIADFIVKNSNHITVVSSYIKERLKETVSSKLHDDLESKLSIIPMGVDIIPYKKNFDKKVLKEKYGFNKKFVLLFFGRLAKKKGISYLLKAMPAILKEIEDIMLVVCGGGPEKTKLEKLTKELNIIESVKFTGFVSEKEKIEYFSQADILIVPSIITEEGDTEGLPVVIMEGLASGLPIIASDVGGIKDVVIDRETGILIQSKSPEAIEKSVVLLIEDEELRQYLGKNGQIFAKKNLSWEIISERYYEILIKKARRFLFEKN